MLGTARVLGCARSAFVIRMRIWLRCVSRPLTRALRAALIWGQCALLIAGVPLPAAADGPDGSTPKATRDASVTSGQSGGVFQATSDPFTGAAQLNFPIEVAPGTNGVQPTLALAYSSSGQAPSWVGKGWSLELGSVQRTLKRGVPNYRTDTLTLNGEELVPDPTDPRPVFGQPTRFRTRRESYQRIDLVGGGMEVRQTDGTLLRFGTTANSRVLCTTGRCLQIAQEAGAALGVPPIFPVFAWHLDFVETPDGNVVQYLYYAQSEAEGDVGRLYPREIRYTLRRASGGALTSLNGMAPPQDSVDRVVSFVLAPRSDTRVSFEAGFERRMTKRLERIEVKVAGRTLRAYALKYTSSEDSFASLLTAIDTLGVDGAGTPLTSTFAYSGNRPMNCPGCGSVWRADSRFRLPGDVEFLTIDRQDGGVRIADMDTDGIQDVVRFTNNRFVAATGNGVYPGRPDGGFPRLANSGTLLSQMAGFNVFDRGSGGPVVSADQGTLLADLTGDGIVDQLVLTQEFALSGQIFAPKGLVRRGLSGNQVFSPFPAGLINDVHLSFIAPLSSGGQLIPHSVGGGAALAELNGDGFPDIVQSSLFGESNNDRGIFIDFSLLNNGTSQPTFNIFGAHSICATLLEPAFAGRTCEVDGLSVRTFASLFAGPVGGEPQGKRYYDVNGDGLDDFQSAYRASFLAQGSLISRFTVLNNGTAFERQPSDMFNLPGDLVFESQSAGFLGSPTLDSGVRLMDVNADGISDVVIANEDPFARDIYLGTQSPAQPWRLLPPGSHFTIPGDMSFINGDRTDRGVRNFDMDGDLVQDLNGAAVNFRQAYRNAAVVPDLLTVATSPQGGTQTFAYGTSARERNGDGSPKSPGLHLNMAVVKTVTVDDLKNPPVTTTFEYEGGRFDAEDREFRGFRKVRAIRAADGRITETVFHQDLPRAGLVRTTSIKDRAGNLLVETTNAYTDEDAPQPRAPFARLPAGSLVVEVPRSGSSASPRITAMQILYQRDSSNVIQFGRVAAMVELGDVNVFDGTDIDPGDTRTMELEYTPVDPSAYITNKVSVMRLRAGSPGQGAVVREMRMAYDGALVDTPSAPLRGLLTTMVGMLDDPVDPNPTTTFTYDAFGNMKSVTSPRANANQGGGTTMMFVDPTFRTFMERVVNPAGHETKLTYTPDPAVCPDGPPVGLGLVYTEQGPNDTATTRAVRCYDRFGRTLLERASGDLAETRMAYVDAPLDRPGSSEMTATQRSSSGGGTRSTRMLLDGFGRPVEMRSEGPGGTTIVMKTALDAAGRSFETRPPFFSSDPEPEPTRTEYDALDRVIRVTRPSAPEGSPSAVGPRVETADFDPTIITATDANGNVRRRTTDPFGNVVKVEEVTLTSTFTTTYAYDVANSLTRITDHAGNVTRIEYDRLGRRIRIVDPDTGTKNFKYDPAGNIKEERGPSGTLTFDYDVLDRLRVRRIDGVADRTVSYDTAPKGIGLPATVTDSSGAGVRRVLEYDARGPRAQGKPRDRRLQLPLRDELRSARSGHLAHPAERCPVHELPRRTGLSALHAVRHTRGRVRSVADRRHPARRQRPGHLLPDGQRRHHDDVVRAWHGAARRDHGPGRRYRPRTTSLCLRSGRPHR